MATVERANITLPIGLCELAHEHGINVSRVSANAVMRAVQAIEKETGDASAKTAPAVTPEGATT